MHVFSNLYTHGMPNGSIHHHMFTVVCTNAVDLWLKRFDIVTSLNTSNTELVKLLIDHAEKLIGAECRYRSSLMPRPYTHPRKGLGTRLVPE